MSGTVGFGGARPWRLAIMLTQNAVVHVATGCGLWVLAFSAVTRLNKDVAYDPVVLALLLPMGIVLHMRAAHITAQYADLNQRAESLQLRNEQLEGEKQRLEFDRAMLVKQSNDAAAAAHNGHGLDTQTSPDSVTLPLFVRSAERVNSIPQWDASARQAHPDDTVHSGGAFSFTTVSSLQSSVLLSTEEAVKNAPATWAPLLSSDDAFPTSSANPVQFKRKNKSWDGVRFPVLERISKVAA